VAEFRYRVYEPETPRDLPIELVQEWSGPLQFQVGQEVEMTGETWRIVAIEADPDPAFDGRVFFQMAITPPQDPPAL
jgi:hypothetical protein